MSKYIPLWLHSLPNYRAVAQIIDLDTDAVLDWGDGTAPVRVHPGRKFPEHAYPTQGSYMVTLTGMDGVNIQRTPIFIRPGAVPRVFVRQRVDSPGVVEVKFDDLPTYLVSDYSINWGDGSVGGGMAPTVETHVYEPGDYEITVRDYRSHRVGRYPVTVGSG